MSAIPTNSVNNCSLSTEDIAKRPILMIPNGAILTSPEVTSQEMLSREASILPAEIQLETVTLADESTTPPKSANIVLSTKNLRTDRRDLTLTRSGESDLMDPPEAECSCGLVLAVLAIIVGGSFQTGYQFGWVISSQQVISEFIQKTGFANDERRFKEFKTWIWTAVVSSYALGAVFGSMAAATLADKYGRKTTLFFNNVWATVGVILMTICYTTQTWHFILFARLIFGFNAGISCVVVPIYLTEISPINLRGTIGSFHQLFILIAILIGDLLSIKSVFGTADKWQHIYGMTFLPIVAQLILLKFCPESPYFSIVFGDDESEAEDALTIVRGNSDVDYEMNVIKRETAKTEPDARLGTVFSMDLRWSTTLSVFVVLMRQLSGMEIIIQYGADIANAVGLTSGEGLWAVSAVLAISVVITLLSAWLVDSTCFGRRVLLLIGIFGMFFSSVAVVLALILIENRISVHECSITGILFTITFAISYSVGPGSIPWFYVTELYTTRTRANGMSFACIIGWMITFIVAFAFPFAKERFSSYTFLIFVVPLFASGIISLIHITETKGKSITEIQNELDDNRPRCC